MPRTPDFTDAELTAYIAEALPLGRSVEMERAIRASTELQSRLAQLIAVQDDAPSSVTDFWRTRRVACPTRATWQAYLDHQIGGEFREYLRFHLDDVGCRYCAANLADLQTASDADAAVRVRKIFATSIGQLQRLPANDGGSQGRQGS